MSTESQTFAVKRAEVEFHNFASLGEPEYAISVYAEENERRGGLIAKYLDFIGPLTPFLEVGANAGHTSYLLANQFGAQGFALDLSADALRYGAALMDRWNLTEAPVRVAGDALHLPFRDGSLQFVMTFQTLSQFLDIESVFAEIHRVLAPGGVFLFAEEPLRRMLSLRLYRASYYRTMKPWERKLYDWGLLGYLVRDVIGAEQEESFGIRQNHKMYLHHWRALIDKYFAESRYDLFVPQRGWGERWMKRLGVRLDPNRSEWRAARLLGGTIAAFCRKAGGPDEPFLRIERFEEYLRCPDCGGGFRRDANETLVCHACGYEAPQEGGVYTVLRSEDRRELYPGDREDIIDFSQPGHETRLGAGWHQLEGQFGGKYRWMTGAGFATLRPAHQGPQRLRIRGHVHERSIAKGVVRIAVRVNGSAVGQWTRDRSGLFVLEADLPPAPQYDVEIQASPVWQALPDRRELTLHFGLIRLIPRA
ncbi:MAG: class I SAM-dependent methyltransferase [Bryobacterales bacterium]|nr:class I SAM-dependent methyltransferase [Bryobacterales bacterium]